MNPRRSPGTARLCPLPPPSEIYVYRSHAQAILRRYFRVSLEIGRLPSLLGGQVFRARVTSYHLHTFEDLVIFAHDVERCLEELPGFGRKLVTHVIFQGYTPAEAARILACGSRAARRALRRAIDQLSKTFLERGILTLFPAHLPENSRPRERCQAPVLLKEGASACEHWEKNSVEKGQTTCSNLIF